MIVVVSFLVHCQVIVVWNNVIKSPPPFDLWPKIAQPLQIIQPKANRLSNRCVLHITVLLCRSFTMHVCASLHECAVICSYFFVHIASHAYRFYPYAEIETDAVLSIDDDINMLSAAEIQFGFEV